MVLRWRTLEAAPRLLHLHRGRRAPIGSLSAARSGAHRSPVRASRRARFGLRRTRTRFVTAPGGSSPARGFLRKSKIVLDSFRRLNRIVPSSEREPRPSRLLCSLQSRSREFRSRSVERARTLNMADPPTPKYVVLSFGSHPSRSRMKKTTMELSLKNVSDHKLLRSLDELEKKNRQDEADLLEFLRRSTSAGSISNKATPRCIATAPRCSTSRRRRPFTGLALRGLRAHIRTCSSEFARARFIWREPNLLAPRLTPENHVELLDLARHKSKRAIEELLADRAPKPDVPGQVRKLPVPRSTSAVRMPLEIAESSREVTICEAVATPTVRRGPSPVPSPLGGTRFKIQFTGSETLCGKLREAQALLRHQIPDGDLAEIFGRALALLLEDAKRKKFAQTSRPRGRSKAAKKPGTASRHIPAQIKRSRCRAGRGSVCVRRSEWSPLRLARFSRVPSHRHVGQGEATLDRPNRAPLSRAQSPRGVTGLWGRTYGALRDPRSLPPGAARRRAAGMTPVEHGAWAFPVSCD